MVVPSSSARRDYQPGTLARLSQQWDETNRAAVTEGPTTADGLVAVAPAGEPNSELMLHLFQRASRDFTAAANYARVSFFS